LDQQVAVRNLMGRAYVIARPAEHPLLQTGGRAIEGKDIA
jgi:hypothetical protein